MSRLIGQVVAACVVAAAVGFRARARPKAKAVVAGNSSGAPGFVDSLWTYGGPEIGKPALTSFGGCFKGRHVVLVRNMNADNMEADLVSVVSGQTPLIRGQGAQMELQMINPDGAESVKACGSGNTNKASGKGKMELHNIPEYLRLVEKTGARDAQLAYAYFALITAGQQEAAEAKVGVERYGYGLVASAHHSGGLIVGGPQVAHLIQHPQTLDCVVTFQFTKVRADWYNNLKFITVGFCGQPGKVHRGLANALRLTVNSTEWQAKVRPKLQFCRKVIAVGHSQGAAQAELFSACNNQRPTPNNDEYNSMSWSQSTPTRMDYL